MSDFFLRLAERTQGLAAAVRPLIVSRYLSGPELQRNADGSDLIPDAPTRSRESVAAVSPVATLPDVLPHNPLPNESGGSIASDNATVARTSSPLPLPTKTSVTDSSPAVGRTQTTAHTSAAHTSAAHTSAAHTSAAQQSGSVIVRSAEVPAGQVESSVRFGRRSDGSAAERSVPGPSEHRESPVPVTHGIEAAHGAAFQQAPLVPASADSFPGRVHPVAELQDDALATVRDPAVQEQIQQPTRWHESAAPQPAVPVAQFDLAADSAGSESRRNSAQPPVIRVTIGRIEVRAIMPAATTERQRPALPRPVMSLDEYLKQGHGRTR